MLPETAGQAGDACAADRENGSADGQQSQSRGFGNRQSSPLEGQSNSPHIGVEGTSHSVRSELVDPWASPKIRHKQIARAVKGQVKRLIQSGSKGASRTVGREFIDVASDAPSRHEQVTCAVESQSTQPLCRHRGKDALHPVGAELINDAIGYHKQVTRPVKSQSIRGIQSRGKSAPHS